MKQLKKILQYNKLFMILFLISLSYALIITKSINYKSVYKEDDTNFICTVLDKKIDGNKLSLTLKCREKLVSTYYIKTLEEKEYLETNLEYGSELSLIGTLSIPTNNTAPNLFNYKEYLYNNRIYYILNINTLTIENKSKNVFYKIKNLAYKHAKEINNEYIYAFTLGNTNYFEEKTLSSFRENGISHLLALSGLHVSVFSLIIMKLFKKLKIKNSIIIFLTTILLLLFSFISGFSISLLRATFFFSFISIFKLLNIKVSNINVLLLVCSIFLFYEPFNLYNISFLFSFTTTYFILLINNHFNNYFKSLLLMSIYSYLASLGLSIYYFGYTNPLGIIYNLLFIPLISFIVFPLSLLTYILPFLSPLLNTLIYVFETINSLLTNINISIYYSSINIFYIIIYYILLVLSIKKNHKFFVIIVILLIFLKIKPYMNSEYKVMFLDVGQGDSSLIIAPHLKYVIMIDTGGKVKYETEEWKKPKKKSSISNNTLIPVIRKNGINKIDYLIITHGDYDHMGEAINLVNNFKVEKVIFNCGGFNDLEQELIKVLDKKKVKYYSCIKELNIDKSKLYFLQTKEYDNENDNSNVIYTEINEYKFMFMGDASITTEKEIIDEYNLPDIDVLKVGHHGSKTSSGKEFINEINPKYSIISVGKNNRYGHPNKEVLDNLEDSKIYRTDIDGSIMFKIKNNKLKVETCSP